MAETLVSPGVLARENDQSFITEQPIQVGAAIVGPTVKGPVEIPTIVTSYSDFQNRFGTSFQSGSDDYSFFTSIAAQNYFNNGGASLLVTRVVSGSSTWDYASAGVANGVPASTGDQYIAPLSSSLTGTTTGSYYGFAINTGNQSLYAGDYFIGIAGVLAAGTVQATYSSTVTNPNTGLAETYNTHYVSMGGVSTWNVDTWGANMTKAVNATLPSKVSASYDAAGDMLYFTGSSQLTVPQDALGFELYTVVTPWSPQITGLAAGGSFTGGSAGTSNIAFTLESLYKGASFNNSSSILSNNSLESGSAGNIRWEVTTADTSSGTFSLVIRQGNDSQNNKSVLETWPNLSLDPKQDNYIAKVIGDQKFTYNSIENYIQITGDYRNASRYVRVSNVAYPTPDYFDNNGAAKSAYKPYIPVVGSGSYGGSFSGGVGSIIPTGRTMNMYNNINAVDSQGLVGSDYNDMLRLLANADEYKYNLLLLPGLTNANHTSQITTAIQNAQSRGDNMVVVDPVQYGATQTAALTQAASRNTSYAAMYWPWLQTLDPSTGKQVWLPASTLMGGVFAFNDNAGEPWFAPAGINRGGMGSVIRAERKLSQSNRDDLYEGNVNPIAQFPGTGTVVYGQKTLQKTASALDRVNVRRLLITLKSYISQVAQNLVFEQNTAATRNNFLSQVNPYLESVQQRQGLYAFKVVMDDSNNTPDVIDRNQLVGAIYIQPTKTAEFIYLDFNILPTGATFPA